MLAPILVHTAEEAWSAMKYKPEDVESIHLAEMPKADNSIDWQTEKPKWDRLMELRDEVLRVLENLRQQQAIGSNQQACITIHSKDEQLNAVLNEFGLKQFAALCIVSEAKLHNDSDQTKITAEKSTHQKCQRCWNYWRSVGSDSKYPDLCERCISVIRKP